MNKIKYITSNPDCPGLSSLSIRLSAASPITIANNIKCGLPLHTSWYADSFRILYTPGINNVVIYPEVPNCLNDSAKPEGHNASRLETITFYIQAFVLDKALPMLTSESSVRALAKTILITNKNNIIKIVKPEKILDMGDG